jgi:hypothetical protein
VTDAVNDVETELDDEPEPEVDDDGAAARGGAAQGLLDQLRADTDRLARMRAWVEEVIEREARLTAYLKGEWLEDRDLLLTAGAVEGDLDVFDEDEPWEVIARAQAARRALHHALREE